MAKTKFVVAFLFLFSFVFFRKDVPGALGASQSRSSKSAPRSLILPGINPQNFTVNNSVISKSVTKKDHVKIRYMGGECSFAICSTPFFQIFPEFSDGPVSIAPYFLIPSREQYLFGLRGPPHIDLYQV